MPNNHGSHMLYVCISGHATGAMWWAASRWCARLPGPTRPRRPSLRWFSLCPRSSAISSSTAAQPYASLPTRLTAGPGVTTSGLTRAPSGPRQRRFPRTYGRPWMLESNGLTGSLGCSGAVCTTSRTRSRWLDPPSSRTRRLPLEILTGDADFYLDNMHRYGSLLLGRWSTVAYADQGRSGTKHVLPAGRGSRYTGALLSPAI